VLFSPVRQHWFTVHRTSKSVVVYDSLRGKISEATRRTVQTLARRGSRIAYSRTCSQQTHTDDCSCYALAYTATIALGGTKTSHGYCCFYTYIHNSVCSCFENWTTRFNLRQSCTRLLLFASVGVSGLTKYARYAGDPATFDTWLKCLGDSRWHLSLLCSTATEADQLGDAWWRVTV